MNWLTWLTCKLIGIDLRPKLYEKSSPTSYFKARAQKISMTHEEIVGMNCPPCPFCGNDDISLQPSSNTIGFFAQCKQCGARTGTAPTDRAACESWAKRWKEDGT